MALQQLADRAAAVLEVPDAVIYGLAQTTYAALEPVLTPFEHAIQHYLPQQLVAYMYNIQKTAFRTKPRQLPLQNPSHAIFVAVCYLLALFLFYVIGKVLGKRKYRLLGMLHNCFLFLLSAYMAVTVCVTAVASGYSLVDIAPSAATANDWRMAKILYIFYISKIPEFGDTFLMMLKQNYHQVTFLHLYHHFSIFLVWWYVLIVSPSGDPYWSAMVNSAVHVFMYGYYFGTMLFESGKIRQFLDNIKFMITKIQMFQFLLNLIHASYLMIIDTSRVPLSIARILFWYMLSLLALFGNFLYRGQKKQKEGKSGKKPPQKGVTDSKKNR